MVYGILELLFSGLNDIYTASLLCCCSCTKRVCVVIYDA